MNNRDRNRKFEELRQSIALGRLANMPKLEPWMNRPATKLEADQWEAAYRKLIGTGGYDFAALPRGTGFLRASTHFGFPVSCGRSPISDAMRLEALTAGNLSGASAKNTTISGLALPYMKPSITLPGETATMFARNCFTKDLQQNPNRKIYYESGFGCVLGSVQSGTGRIWEEPDGLHFEAIVPPTHWADEMLVSMRRADVKESAAMCQLTEAHWDTRLGVRTRVVTAAALFGVKVVAFPDFDSATAEVKDSLAAAAARLAKLQGGLYGSRF